MNTSRNRRQSLAYMATTDAEIARIEAMIDGAAGVAPDSTTGRVFDRKGRPYVTVIRCAGADAQPEIPPEGWPDF